MHAQLDKGLGNTNESNLPVTQQNLALRQQLNQLAKALYEFSSTIPDRYLIRFPYAV